MALYDEAKRLRIRGSELKDTASRLWVENLQGSACLVARTLTLQTYPTAARSYFACNPLTVLGTESEGAPGVVSVESGVFFALNLGSTIPPAGTNIVVTFVGNRWVFRYDG